LNADPSVCKYYADNLCDWNTTVPHQALDACSSESVMRNCPICNLQCLGGVNCAYGDGGPTFGVHFSLPGSTCAPVRCRSSAPVGSLGIECINPFSEHCRNWQGKYVDGFNPESSSESTGTDPVAEAINCLPTAANASGSGEPASTEACGASCVANFWEKDYQRVSAMRKLVYDTQGGHYTAKTRECATLVDHGERDAAVDASADHFTRYTVKIPEEYNASCVNSTWCNINGTYGLFHQCCTNTVTRNCTVEDKLSCLSQRCAEKAMLTAADAMWQVSWLAGCTYLWDASAKIIEAQGPCDKAGNGFVYIFSTTAYCAGVYFVLILVSYLAMHAFDKTNYAEGIQHTQNKLGFDSDATMFPDMEQSGMEMADANDLAKDDMLYDGTEDESKTEYDPDQPPEPTDGAEAVTGQI